MFIIFRQQNLLQLTGSVDFVSLYDGLAKLEMNNEV